MGLICVVVDEQGCLWALPQAPCVVRAADSIINAVTLQYSIILT